MCRWLSETFTSAAAMPKISPPLRYALSPSATQNRIDPVAHEGQVREHPLQIQSKPSTQLCSSFLPPKMQPIPFVPRTIHSAHRWILSCMHTQHERWPLVLDHPLKTVEGFFDSKEIVHLSLLNDVYKYSAVGIAADRAAINAAIGTAGSRHSRAGFDLIKRLRSFLPAPAEKGLTVSLLIVSSLLFFTSQHASRLRSYGSCSFFDAEREAAELKSSRQVSVGIRLWRASADVQIQETGARQEIEWPAADAVDGLRVFVWRNAAISAADHAADPINPNSRMLSSSNYTANQTATGIPLKHESVTFQLADRWKPKQRRAQQVCSGRQDLIKRVNDGACGLLGLRAFSRLAKGL
ncbi:hypothetical protein C8R45DRAFT_921935 [Mycena sanguinolenta]|nr:hypothetical protein C8R45DRAFT_921935 [Mycena sanguinolenta]